MVIKTIKKQDKLQKSCQYKTNIFTLDKKCPKDFFENLRIHKSKMLHMEDSVFHDEMRHFNKSLWKCHSHNKEF